MTQYDRRDRYELRVTQLRGDYGELHRFRSPEAAWAAAQPFIASDSTKQAFKIVIRDRRRDAGQDIVKQYPE